MVSDLVKEKRMVYLSKVEQQAWKAHREQATKKHDELITFPYPGPMKKTGWFSKTRCCPFCEHRRIQSLGSKKNTVRYLYFQCHGCQLIHRVETKVFTKSKTEDKTTTKPPTTF